MTKTRFTKEQRQAIHAKYGYRCAYCGKPITYSEMQVDHLIPQFLKGSAAHQHLVEQIDSFDNLMPSCRRCNHYKRGNSIETFREWIRTIPSKLMRDSYIFKVGCDYGMWNSQNPPSIKFYFETSNYVKKHQEQLNEVKDINFSPKQDEILLWWFDNQPTSNYNGIIVDGGVQSGKSFVTGLSFLMWAMKNFNNKRFLISSKTSSSICRNILNPLKPLIQIDFDIELYQLNCGWRYTLTNKLTGVSNIFYIIGERDMGSEMVIWDLTLSGVMFDEPVLMSRAFVDQCIARCSEKNVKLWFACTPESPFNWFYREWICKRNSKGMLYKSLSLDDNLSLDEKTKSRYESLYSGVFYERMIKGRWQVAEGLIYPMFCDDNIALTSVKVISSYAEKFYISIDYGTINPFSAALWCTFSNKIVRLKEYYYSSRETGQQLTDEEYYKAIKELAKGYKITKVIVDNSAASFIETIRSHNEFEVEHSSPDLIEDIGYTAELIETGRLYVCESCNHLIKEISEYKWSSTQNMPIRANDHCCDDMRYFVGYYKSLKA